MDYVSLVGFNLLEVDFHSVLMTGRQENDEKAKQQVQPFKN